MANTFMAHGLIESAPDESERAIKLSTIHIKYTQTLYNKGVLHIVPKINCSHNYFLLFYFIIILPRMFASSSSIVRGFLAYAMLYIYPHKKKSRGVESADRVAARWLLTLTSWIRSVTVY